MGYVGRIGFVIVIWLVSFTWIAYMFISVEEIYENWTEMVAAAAVIIGFFSIIGWQLGRKYDRVKFFSEKDTLTGTYNRHYIYYKAFRNLVKQAKKRKQNLILFMYDIDDLKVINDKYGHLEGDQVIQATASLLIRQTRKSDVVARWGGDEFMVLALDMNEEEAESIIARIKAETSKLPLKQPLQLSAGYALYQYGCSSLEELIAKADEWMYARKKAAKDREQVEIL